MKTMPFNLEISTIEFARVIFMYVSILSSAVITV